MKIYCYTEILHHDYSSLKNVAITCGDEATAKVSYDPPAGKESADLVYTIYHITEGQDVWTTDITTERTFSISIPADATFVSAGVSYHERLPSGINSPESDVYPQKILHLDLIGASISIFCVEAWIPFSGCINIFLKYL